MDATPPVGGNGRHSGSSSVGVVITGDNHLSPTLPRLSPQRRATRREWLRAGFQAAVDYALTHDAALFINAGDLFDNPAPSNQDRAFVATELARLGRAGVVCVAIGGNHDTPRLLTEHGGESPQQVYAALDGFHYFAASDTLTPLLLTLRGLRVAVAGLSNNPVAAPGSDPLATAARYDPEGALAESDTGVVILHAAIEGLARPTEGERAVSLASLATLPAAYQVVVAGHIHRFGHQRMKAREVVVAGATERMEFGGAAGAPGFVWMELGSGGVRTVDHIRVPSQPRADLTLSVADLWPDAEEPGDPLAAMRAALEPHAGPDTMARLRLTGELSRERYHQLALRDIVIMGQQRFFSLDIDTSGLTIVDPTLTLPTFESDGESRALPDVIQRALAEFVERSAAGEEGAPSEADARAASELLLARLRDLDAMDGEAV